MSIVIAKSRLVYQLIAVELETAGFVLELRVIFLLLLSHLLLNVRIRDVIKLRRYRWVRRIVYMYLLAVLLVQARSRIFEVVAIIAFAQLMWNRDKPLFRYLLFMGFSVIVPNIIVLARLGWPGDVAGFVDILFSFEYTILFNNLLSAAIAEGKIAGGSYTFASSMGLLIPSPIRQFFDITVLKSEYYAELSQAAYIGNGGFSLLAELFSNFGWNSVWVFGCMGSILGFLNSRALRVGRASLKTCIAPLLYVAFILAFRNDLGVFAKQVIQIIIIAFAMDLITKVKITNRNRYKTI